ncbi:MAG: hypothetical protein JJ892_03675 [Balneola sp.]|nr:hypothetical protein [Balneola sp.]MBO6650757.1 hypothetical protein [Balneola sp.]MBO6710670.1 hypothetical protein [Balneola sp.]MBO6799356.1 hypothetical protein [Balneola sp.]MBO6869515.1 hypothetical protein [Balneola sp.]
MSKKTSLGHNPLAYSLNNHASFDFIKSTEEKPVSYKEEQVIQKKVASYYLEESVINHVKEIADKEKKSYSCIVNEFLKEGAENRNDSD